MCLHPCCSRKKNLSPQNTNLESKIFIKHARDYVAERKARGHPGARDESPHLCTVVLHAVNQLTGNSDCALRAGTQDGEQKVKKYVSGLMEWSTTGPPCWLNASQEFMEVINCYSGLGDKEHKKKKIPEINRIPFISRKGTEAWQGKQTNTKKLECLLSAGQSRSWSLAQIKGYSDKKVGTSIDIKSKKPNVFSLRKDFIQFQIS